MNKMVVWFHDFPDEPDTIIDNQLFERIKVSAFKAAGLNQRAKKLFNGDFNGFIHYIKKNNSRESSFNNVEIVLPAKEVLYTKVSVPSKSRNRIMQALPFILDDSLIKDVDKQYLALGNVKSGQCNIAIISRFIITQIYEQFKKLSLPVSIITSELFQLPWHQDKWTIAFNQDEVFIRTGSQSGITIKDNNIDFVFKLLLSNNELPHNSISEVDDEKNKIVQDRPKSIIIYANKQTENVEKIISIAESYHIETETIKGNLLKFALSAQQKNIKNLNFMNRGINLLQGEFNPAGINQINIPFFKTLGTLFVLWMFSQVSFMGYQWYLNKNNLYKVETELEQLYFKTFPDSKRLIDVRSQTENYLKQLKKQSTDDESFLSLLGQVGEKIHRFKDIKIQSLRFNDNVLQLEVLSKGFVFNKLKSSLQEEQGLLVEEKSSSRIKGEVHSVINFRMKN